MATALLICVALLQSFGGTDAARIRYTAAMAGSEASAMDLTSSWFSAWVFSWWEAGKHQVLCNLGGLCNSFGGADTCFPGQEPETVSSKIQSLANLTAELNEIDMPETSELMPIMYRIRGMLSCVKGATVDDTSISELQDSVGVKAREVLREASAAVVRKAEKVPGFQTTLAAGGCAFNYTAIDMQLLNKTAQQPIPPEQVEKLAFGADCDLDKVKIFGAPVLQSIRTQLTSMAVPIQVLMDSVLGDTEKNIAQGLGTTPDKLTEDAVLKAESAGVSASLAELRADISRGLGTASAPGGKDVTSMCKDMAKNKGCWNGSKRKAQMWKDCPESCQHQQETDALGGLFTLVILFFYVIGIIFSWLLQSLR